MQLYTVGFLFTENREFLLLIRKTKPEWQKGRLNGVGGKIKDGETPLQCMIREFEEEAGQVIENWQEFAVITDDCDWTVHFFKTFVSEETFFKCKTKTEEHLMVCQIKALFDPPTLPRLVIENLKWLIPMALSNDNGAPFKIIEKGI
jgi:8-oxo-dGTP diphosphatase